MSVAEDYFKFLCYAHENAIRFVEQLKFDKNHAWHLNLVSLYCTIIELAGSICVLVKENICIGIPIILRSAVEADIEFTNLSADRAYGYHMRASQLTEWIKILQESVNGVNPFLKDLGDLSESKEKLLEMKQELSELKSKKYGPLSIFDKFDKAKLVHVYKSIYNSLCCHSHNNLRSLHSRHVSIDHDKMDFKVELYVPVDFNDILPYIDIFCGILISATVKIHTILDTKCINEVEKLNDDLVIHRRKLLTEQPHSLDSHGYRPAHK